MKVTSEDILAEVAKNLHGKGSSLNALGNGCVKSIGTSCHELAKTIENYLRNIRDANLSTILSNDQVKTVRKLLARIEENYGHEVWTRSPHTDLEEAAQAVAKIFPPEKLPPDRSHEECAECLFETADPPECEGHSAGETPCRTFQPNKKEGVCP